MTDETAALPPPPGGAPPHSIPPPPPPPSSSADTTTPPSKNSKPLEISVPNATLYVSNIDWGIKKPVLKRALLALFGRHGKILDVITLRKEGLRGQAWIIYNEISSATAALRAEQNFCFFGKELKIAYAREKSDRVAKMDGTYIPKDRRVAKRRKLEEAAAAGGVGGGDVATMGSVDALATNGAPVPPTTASVGDVGGAETNGINPPTMTSAPPSAIPSAAIKSEDNTSSSTPSNILFASDLPAECNDMMLAMLFQVYAGYKEVRLPRPGAAFIEFDDEHHATLALKGLSGFNLTTNDRLNLSYAKV